MLVLVLGAFGRVGIEDDDGADSVLHADGLVHGVDRGGEIT